MRPALKVIALAGLVASACAGITGLVGDAAAQGEAAVGRSARGGLVARTARNQFEVFFYPTGLRVFPMDAAGAPLEAAGLRGTATFYHPNSLDPWFTRPIEGGAAAARQGQSSLDLVLELTSVPPAGTRVAFAIAGLPDAPSFTVPFELAGAAGAATATATAAVPAAGPRYVFGPGSNGFGYYQAPAPVNTAPAVRQGSGGRSTTRTRDWSTGQNLPTGGLLSKPWLKPSR